MYIIKKNKVCFLILSILIPLTAISQSYSYGPCIGINTINTYNNSTDSRLYSLGYNFGLFAERKVFKNFSLGLSFNVTQKKFASEDFHTSSFIGTMDKFLNTFNSFLPVEISIKEILETYLGTSASLINDTVFNYYRDMTSFTYFEMPLLMTYRYKRISFQAGPVFSFIYKARSNTMSKQEIPLLDMLPVSLFDTMEYGAYIDTVFNNITTTSDYASFNMGLLAGLTYELYDNVILCMYYSQMFSNLYDNSKKKAYHSLFNLSLKYNLRPLFKSKPSFTHE